MRKHRLRALRFLVLASLTAGVSAFAQIQVLPDAPGTSSTLDAGPGVEAGQAGQQPSSVHEDPQPKRIFGILPNFRAVTAGTKLPPQTVKGKFITASEDSFDYSAVLLAVVVAGYSDAVNDTPEFGSGGIGYGRYLWHTYVDQTSENYFVEFIVPVITHEDTRFYSLGKGGFGKRLGYAVSRTFVTRSDSGHTVFNAGEIVGAGVSAAVSNLYYPSPERTFGNTLDKYGTSVGIDLVSFVVKEFYPDINHKLFHQKAQPAQTTP
jgi:hypothetical protein